MAGGRIGRWTDLAYCRLLVGGARVDVHSESGGRSLATGNGSGPIGEATAVLAASVSGVGLAIALAALIFTGPLADGLSRATTNFVLASAIVTLVVGVQGGFKPTIAVLQDGPAIVVVTLAASVAGSAAPNPTLDVFVLIAIATLLSGLAMVAIGYVGAGDVVRFLPTTVISGFIAGTGWLLAKGGFDVMLDTTLGLDDLSGLLEPEAIKFWLPGAALGVLIQVLGLSRRVHDTALSAAVIAAVVLFFGIVFAFSSIEAVQDANWLIGPFPDGTIPSPLTPAELGDADWDEVLRRPGGVFAAVAVALVAVLLNLSGLESLTGDRLDTRRELKSAGIANILIAPLGSVAGFHALGDTALAHQMGARTKAVPVGIAAACAGVALFGSQLIGLTPRLIAGGLLVAVGLALLISWIESMRATSSRVERVLGVAIPVSIGAVGILEGITFGVVAACLIFVARYSRIDPVEHEATAIDMPSRVVRSATETEVLSQTADRIVVFQLTGYQFFGSFASVADRVRARTEAADPPVSSVVLDFRHVTGIDSSAFALLGRLASDLANLDAQLLLSDLDADLAGNITDTTTVLTERLDFAIERAENALLAAQANGAPTPAVPFPSLSSELIAQLTRRCLVPGEALIEQGSDDAAMFLILSGTLVVVKKQSDGSQHRLRRIGSGAVVGEHALLLNEPRTAGITAESAVEVLEVTAADYERLRRKEPTLALELQDHLLHELANRSVSLSEHLSQALR